MDGTDIAAIITATGVVLGLIGAGIKWMIELVLSQSRSTITELREENAELETENDALKAENQTLKARIAGTGGTA